MTTWVEHIIYPIGKAHLTFMVLLLKTTTPLKINRISKESVEGYRTLSEDLDFETPFANLILGLSSPKRQNLCILAHEQCLAIVPQAHQLFSFPFSFGTWLEACLIRNALQNFREHQGTAIA